MIPTRRRRCAKSRRLPPLLATLAIGVGIATGTAVAHPLAPSLLELREGPAGVGEVVWKTSLYQPRGSRVEPVLPEACQPVGGVRSVREGSGQVSRWQVNCGAGELAGRRLGVTGLAAGGTNAIVRVVRRNGETVHGLLTAGQPFFEIPLHSTPKRVFRGYLRLGVEHLWRGFDHVLFVLGLMLLIRGRKALLIAITSFTLGHSITLSLATLGYASFPSGLIEVGIAASLLWLAVEVPGRLDGRPSRLQQRPWMVTLAFGLLHGLGFASALAEIGLPRAEIPLALLAFNLGIELGQISLVLLAGALALGWHSLGLTLHPQRGRWAAAYAMGSLSAFWVFERALAALATSP